MYILGNLYIKIEIYISYNNLYFKISTKSVLLHYVDVPNWNDSKSVRLELLVVQGMTNYVDAQINCHLISTYHF